MVLQKSTFFFFPFLFIPFYFLSPTLRNGSWPPNAARHFLALLSDTPRLNHADVFFMCLHIYTWLMNEVLQNQLIEDICRGSEFTGTHTHTPSQEIHDTVSAPFNLRDKKTDEYDRKCAKTVTERKKKKHHREKMLLSHKTHRHTHT